ncbi:MAG: hypothetical protein OXM02_15110 [Bacteroidota bacterium]|nr:hypothetical protein [Bacteroidota bacterium]
MDESLVDIILILLAGLAAVSIMPEFDVQPPTSVEVEESANMMLPLQIALTADGVLLVKSPQSREGLTGQESAVITPQQLFAMVVASDEGQAVEIVADHAVSAKRVLDVNLIVQQAGRQAVFIVRAE